MFHEFAQLVDVIRKLRDPESGCPWDLKQTHKSLLKYLIEESYEFIHATETDDTQLMEEEIGDVLLQVLLHCQIASEQNHFNLESVSRHLTNKMIRRHPHVFNENHVKIDSDEVKKNWELIKRQEKSTSPESTNGQTLIKSDLLHFPALFASNKIGEKTAKIHFDWDNASDVLGVVQDEWEEFKAELSQRQVDKKKMQEEFGDLLFSMAQLGRHLGLQPEESLYMANKKFLRRFHRMEELIFQDKKDILKMNQAQMDEYWKLVKEEEHVQNKT